MDYAACVIVCAWLVYWPLVVLFITYACGLFLSYSVILVISAPLWRFLRKEVIRNCAENVASEYTVSGQ